MKYRLLGRSAMRVSELALGTMTFGEKWGWGASLDESRRMIDLYLDRCGNFIDTASNYTDGQSEAFLGELLGDRRERIVLASKYTLTSNRRDPNAGGNHRRNMVQSVERSLRRMRTDRIDLLWMHMWDGMTPIEEVMRAFDDLVASGKVLAVGISDTPAWVISRGVAIAEQRGWTVPSAIQLPYSVAGRDAERELLPMASQLGMAVTAWGVLNGGILTGKYGRPNDEPRRYGEEAPSERSARAAAAIKEVADECEATPAQVSIAWALARRPEVNLIPILGARTGKQLEENLGALNVRLDAEMVRKLDDSSGFQVGFPRSFLADEEVVGLIFGETRGLIEA